MSEEEMSKERRALSACEMATRHEIYPGVVVYVTRNRTNPIRIGAHESVTFTQIIEEDLGALATSHAEIVNEKRFQETPAESV